MDIESINIRFSQFHQGFSKTGQEIQQKSRPQELPRPNQQTRQLNSELKHVKIDPKMANNLATLREIARKVRDHLKQAGIKIQFEVKKDAGKVVVIVKDPVTDKVVREIPPDVYLKLVEHIKQIQEAQDFQGWEIDTRQ